MSDSAQETGPAGSGSPLKSIRKVRNEQSEIRDGQRSSKVPYYLQFLVIRHEPAVTTDMNNKPTNKEDRQ